VKSSRCPRNSPRFSTRNPLRRERFHLRQERPVGSAINRRTRSAALACQAAQGLENRTRGYVHPEFGLLSPTPRLRRELRMVFFSVLLGIGIGAAAVIALIGNKTADEAQVSGLSSASVISEEPTDASLGNKGRDHANKPDGAKVQVNSETPKSDAATTCDATNPACGRTTLPASKPRATRMPPANEAVAIGRAPLGRPGASLDMAPVTPAVSSERAQSTASISEDATPDPGVFKPLTDRKPHRSARSRPQERAANQGDHRGTSRIGSAYQKPAGERDRAYALDRSYGPKGFWDWSR